MSKLRDFVGQATRVIVLSALAAGTFGIVFAWTGPTATPPGNNASAPINLSSTDQTKAGRIYASDFYDTTLGAWLSATGANGKQFGGMFVQNLVNNPFTGTQGCPTTYAIQTRGLGTFWESYNGGVWANVYYCTN